MPPIKDFVCEACSVALDNQVVKQDELVSCPLCKQDMKPLLSYPSNYTIKGDNSASVRPRKMGGGK